MGWNGLERNKLDFILTDLLPVELSELFSYASFYSFLLEHNQQKTLKSVINQIKQNKGKSDLLLFKSYWSTKPLKYNILKGNETVREMSVLQPLSVLNLYIFIELYQKEILDYFEKHHCFSLRYHKKTQVYIISRNKTQSQNTFSHHQVVLEKLQYNN